MALPPVTEVAQGQQGVAEKGRPASAAGVRSIGPAALSLRGGRHCRSARRQGRNAPGPVWRSAVRTILVLSVGIGLVLAGAGRPAEDPSKAPRADLYGDPLPQGAVARLG